MLNLEIFNSKNEQSEAGEGNEKIGKSLHKVHYGTWNKLLMEF